MTSFFMETESLLQQGQLQEALARCGDHLATHPFDKDALYLQGVGYAKLGDIETAIDSLELLLQMHADAVLGYHYLGKLYLQCNQADKAIPLLEHCLKLSPNFIPPMINLGIYYTEQGEFELAQMTFENALSLEPEHPNVLYNLGGLAIKQDDYSRAQPYFEKLLALNTNEPDALHGLFIIAKKTNDFTLGYACYQKTLTLREPGIAALGAYQFACEHCLFDNLPDLQTYVFSIISHYPHLLIDCNAIPPLIMSQPEISAEQNAHIHQIAADMNYPTTISHFNTYQPREEKLKIGLLSADFRKHSVDVFLRGFIEHYNREELACYCYHCAHQTDDHTAFYQEKASAFKSVSDMSNERLAKTIYDDGIDILIDLGGLSENSRLETLVYQPAPIQIAYLGYPFTSGYREVDYYIADPYLYDPRNDALFSERLLPLPECFLSRSALGYQRKDLTPPVLRNGFITFGSLNNIYKINSSVIQTWSQILHGVPDSILQLCHPKLGFTQTCASILAEFTKHGIPAERIELHSHNPQGIHLAHYDNIDICLDTYPITGGTTTFDCQWMSVPLITFVDSPLYQRVSYTILKNIPIDLEDCIAHSLAQYQEKAIQLALNIPRLEALHQSIHAQMSTSILCDPAKHTEQFTQVLQSLPG